MYHQMMALPFLVWYEQNAHDFNSIRGAAMTDITDSSALKYGLQEFSKRIEALRGYL